MTLSVTVQNPADENAKGTTVELPATVCVTHTDSTPAMLEYWACIIARIGRVSRALPVLPSGTLFGGAAQVSVVAESVGPVNVEFEGVPKSAWSFQTRTRSV